MCIRDSRTVDVVDETGEAAKVVVGRLAEVRFVDVNTNIVLSTHNVPYGSTLYVADGEVVEKGKLIAKWDPFNAVIITEATGKIEFESVVAVSYTHLTRKKKRYSIFIVSCVMQTLPMMQVHVR